MAEEILKYKVEIDSSDVAEQLQQIRNNVDLAMSSIAEQQVKPTTFQRVSQVFETANIGGIAESFRQKFEADTQNTVTNMAGMLDRTATTMQLGFSRAAADLRRTGLLAPRGDVPSFAPSIAQPDAFPGMSTTQAAVTASLGTGFDPTGQITRADYMQSATNQLNNAFQNFVQNSGVTTAGTALGIAGGAVGGLPGAVVGGMLGNFVGGAAQTVSDFLTADAAAVTQVAQGLSEIAGANIAGAPSFRAGEGAFRSMAQGMQDYTRSFEGRLFGVTAEEQQNQIAAFAEAGGFKGMDMQQMSQTIPQLPTAVRTVSQNLHMAQSDAANLIADMQRIGMGGDNVLATAGAAVQLGVQGNMMGVGIEGALGIASQGIAATAGSGMATGAAANFAVQSALLTSQAAAAGAPGVSAFNMQMGGAQNAGFAMMEGGLRSMMSPMGMVRTANMMAGGSEGATIQEAMSGAASYFSADPGNIFRSMANQGAMVGEMHPLTVMNAPVQDAVNFLQGTGMFPGQIPADVVSGAMMSFDPSMSASEAHARVGIAGRGADDFFTNSVLSAQQGLVAGERVNQTGPLNRFVTGVTQPFVDFYDATVGEAGRFIQSAYEQTTRAVTDKVTDVLSGTVTEYANAIFNEQRVTDLGQMVYGEHDTLNRLRSATGKQQLTEEQFISLSSGVNQATRDRAVSRFLANSDLEKFSFLNEDSENFDSEAYSIFSIASYGANNDSKQMIAAQIQKRRDAGHDLSDTFGVVSDMYQYDVLMSDHSNQYVAGLGNFDEERITGLHGKQLSQIKLSKEFKEGGHTSIAGFLEAEHSGKSDMEQVNILWNLSGNTGSIFDADPEARAAFMEMFVNEKATMNNMTANSYSSQFGHFGAGIPGGTFTGNNLTDRMVKENINTQLNSHVATSGNRLRDDMAGAIRDRIQGDELTALRTASGLGSDATFIEIADVILGTSESGYSYAQVIENLNKIEGGRDIANKFKSIRTMGAGETIKVNGVEMSLFEGIKIRDALEIKEDVLVRANEMQDILPESLVDDDTAQKLITGIALQEVVTGKATTFSKDSYQFKRMDYLNQLKSRTKISETLETALSADILEGSGRLAGAIDFTSTFEGFDDSVFQAGVEQLKIAHYQKAIDANDQFIKAFVTKDDKTQLNVKVNF